MRVTLTKAGNPREVVTIDSDTDVTVADVVNQASAAFGIDGARISISQEAKGNA